MEKDSNPKHAQSSSDKPSWIEAGLRDRETSVSQLVSRYQTTTVVRTTVRETVVNQAETKPKQVVEEVKPSNLELLLSRNEDRERSRAKTSLTRSLSMGSLPKANGSIESLRALFESKASKQNSAKSSFRDRSNTSTYKAADAEPVMNGETKEVKSTTKEPVDKISTKAPDNDAKDDTKEDQVTQKVLKKSRLERRKTIGGIDFEKLAAFQADEKRKSIADFRDSSITQDKDILNVSVKAMSALYMSKVAPQESNRSLLKQAQDQSSESGKRVKVTKMAEDVQQRTDDRPPPSLARHHHGPVDICGAHSQKSKQPHLSKEELYEQRQKCELRRLLKHTHPEVKMLDEVVDEELAEVLGSEIGATADETGYEGEVLSRRLLFENCALSNKVSPYAHKMHMAERMAERGDVSRTPAVFEEYGVNKSDQRLKDGYPVSDPNQDTERENEEELMKIDVRAARMKFENQVAVNTSIHQIKKHHGKVLALEHETKGLQKPEQKSEMCCKGSQYIQSKTTIKSADVKDLIHAQCPCFPATGQTINEDFSGTEPISSGENSFDDDLDTPDQDKPEKVIQTSAALFKNNPFIPTNIDRECSFVNTPKYESQTGDNVVDQNYQMANVKNKTHVFESMPFHKIRQQNQEEIETMVENIKETLESLHKVNVIHSGGSIIEVNETMLAKRAKFTLSDEGPEISYNEVAEGGAQNFILQLLPRANLKPQIIYLKEGSNKGVEATVVNVPVSHDTEFKSANLVQVVEDILNQDNSLRKGVIFMEDGDRCAEVIVYSLYKYFDPKDIKRYSPAHDSEYETQETERELNKTGLVKSTISSLLHTSKEQTCHGLVRPELEVKGNVKLFMSCIEKGDLEYLKTLQADPTLEEEGVPQSQRMAEQEMELYCKQGDNQEQESTSEWVPVDVKRLKNIFSGDGRPVQPKQSEYLYKSHARSTTVSHSSHNVPVEKSQSSTECSTGISPQVQNTFGGRNTRTQGEACDPPVGPQGSHLHLVAQDGDTVHRAELVQALDDNDEISDLKAAIYSLQQATLEAKSLQEKQKLHDQDSSKELLISTSCGKLSTMEEKWDQGERPCPEQRFNELPSISSDNRLDASHCIQKETTSGQESKEGVQKQLIRDMLMSECSEMNPSQQDDQEVIFQGKLQAALDSLGKSNINVTRGDFREAMIYRSSSKPCNQQSQRGNEVSVTVIDQRSAQEPMKQEGAKTQVTKETLDPLDQTESFVHALGKSVSPTCSEPAVLSKSSFNELPSLFSISSKDKPEFPLESTKIPQQQTTIGQGTEEAVQDQCLRDAPLCSYSSDMNSSQQDEEEVVLQGKLQAALDSLSKSNVNVTRGDFKAAMEYRSSSKPCNQPPQSGNELSMTDPKPTQKQLKQEVCKKQVARENMVLLKQSGTPNKSSTSHSLEKDKVLVGPKSTILPEPRLNEFSSPFSIISEDISELSLENTEICQRDSNSKEKQTAVAQESKEVVEQNVREAPMSAECSEPMSLQQVDEEVVFQGKLQAALDSLGRSNINVSRGDFRAAMIYRNSSKPGKEQSHTLLVQKTKNEGLPILTEARPTQEPVKQDVPIRQMTAESLEPENQSKTPNKPSISHVLESGRGPAGPKPAIPPKPEHLQSKQKNVQPTNTTNPDTTQTITTGPQEADHTALATTPASHKSSQQMVQVNKARIKVEGSDIAPAMDETNKNIINQKQGENTSTEREGEKPYNLQNKENMGETDESPVDFHGACIKFESKKDISVKCAPTKPKRVKIAKLANQTPKEASNDNSSSMTAQVDKEPRQNQRNEREDKVEMREKKGRTETEDERRERLSVHMDEIMRGNITAAMEIFDNLRKQEELKSILCQVEEIEQDKSEVDMRAMRKVFQDVPGWVVCSKKNNLQKEEGKTEEKRLQPTTENIENKLSVAHVFGNLERASEEIITLKEQTLGRLMDIEEAIKKALYSVSTLKSDSDIAGLSSLFKESLGTVPGSPSSGNISKISIESSRTKSKQTQGNLADVNPSTSVGASPAKQRTSPPSSPAFISIQSAARKMDKAEVPLQDTAICPACQHNPKTEEVFCTTKTVTCNSPAQHRKRRHGKKGKKQSSFEQHNPKQELCQLNVQTNSEGKGIIGTKTVTQNFERTDNFGNRFYSSKTSTVVTTQPDTMTSTGVVVATPATNQVATYPEVWLPINQKP